MLQLLTLVACLLTRYNINKTYNVTYRKVNAKMSTLMHRSRIGSPQPNDRFSGHTSTNSTNSEYAPSRSLPWAVLVGGHTRCVLHDTRIKLFVTILILLSSHTGCPPLCFFCGATHTVRSLIPANSSSTLAYILPCTRKHNVAQPTAASTRKPPRS